MKTQEQSHQDEQNTSLSPQFKILIAIIVGGVLLLLLQVVGIF